MLFSGENFVGEAGGLFEEPPVPEVLPPPTGPEADIGQHKEGLQCTKLLFYLH